jgi:hypothetical protein
MTQQGGILSTGERVRNDIKLENNRTKPDKTKVARSYLIVFDSMLLEFESPFRKRIGPYAIQWRNVRFPIAPHRYTCMRKIHQG